MAGSAEGLTDENVPEVCRSCRFGSGPARDCGLIETGRLDRLVAEGPCDLEARLSAAARSRLERRGLSPDLAEDRRDALLARLGDRQGILVNLGLKRLPEFEDWLLAQLSALIDEGLGGESTAPRSTRAVDSPASPTPVTYPATASSIRCGACRHYRRSGPGDCNLEFVGTDATDLRPNPWWGRKLPRDTDPERLEPSCTAFEAWAPGELDPFSGLIDQKPAASRRDEAARLVCLGLDRLAARDGASLRAASLMRAQVFGGRGSAELATECGLDEIAVVRIIEEAKEALAEILATELRKEPPREL